MSIRAVVCIRCEQPSPEEPGSGKLVIAGGYICPPCLHASNEQSRLKRDAARAAWKAQDEAEGLTTWRKA